MLSAWQRSMHSISARGFRLTGWAVVVCLIVCALSLGGCGPSDEEQVRTVADETLSSYQDPEGEAAQALVSELSQQMGEASWDRLGIDSTAFASAWLGEYQYSIDEVTLDGDTATVQATVTARHLLPTIESWAGSLSGASSLDDVYKQAGSTLLDALSSAEPIQTEIMLSCLRTDDGWTVREDELDAALVVPAFFG